MATVSTIVELPDCAVQMMCCFASWASVKAALPESWWKKRSRSIIVERPMFSSNAVTTMANVVTDGSRMRLCIRSSEERGRSCKCTSEIDCTAHKLLPKHEPAVEDQDSLGDERERAYMVKELLLAEVFVRILSSFSETVVIKSNCLPAALVQYKLEDDRMGHEAVGKAATVAKEVAAVERD